MGRDRRRSRQRGAPQANPTPSMLRRFPPWTLRVLSLAINGGWRFLWIASSILGGERIDTRSPPPEVRLFGCSAVRLARVRCKPRGVVRRPPTSAKGRHDAECVVEFSSVRRTACCPRCSRRRPVRSEGGRVDNRRPRTVWRVQREPRWRSLSPVKSVFGCLSAGFPRPCACRT